tara:strand:+ start:2705 stop:3745 length:1041 start_codon:yes stop_codon:yes gene_type:complete
MRRKYRYSIVQAIRTDFLQEVNLEKYENFKLNNPDIFKLLTTKDLDDDIYEKMLDQDKLNSLSYANAKILYEQNKKLMDKKKIDSLKEKKPEKFNMKKQLEKFQKIASKKPAKLIEPFDGKSLRKNIVIPKFEEIVGDLASNIEKSIYNWTIKQCDREPDPMLNIINLMGKIKIWDIPRNTSHTHIQYTEVNNLKRVIKETDDNKIPNKTWNCPIFRKMYTDKVKDILFNLKENVNKTCEHNENNSQICQKVISGDIDFRKLPYMTREELYPGLWKKVIDANIAKENRRMMENAEMLENDGLFVCQFDDCGSMKTKYTQMQIRSADEPMTTFVYCCTCRRNFRFDD